MQTKRLVSLAAILAAAMPLAAVAADGTITFTGELTAQTCTISGGGGGSASFSVALPKVSTNALATAGSTAGTTPFSISLSGCTPDTGTVHTYFEAGPTTDAATGRLNLTDAGGGQTNATNVQIELLNSDTSAISAGSADGSQNSQTATIASGAATLNYFARYYATGVSTAGMAGSSVMYTMAYQ